MRREMSAAEFRALQARKKKGRSMYYRSAKEKRTVDGITFDSIAEAKRYVELKKLRETGVLKFWRQPAFDLAGVVYRADFLIAFPLQFKPVLEKADPQTFYVLTFEDVKGKFRGPFREKALREFRRNAAQVKALYGVEVELVER